MNIKKISDVKSTNKDRASNLGNSKYNLRISEQEYYMYKKHFKLYLDRRISELEDLIRKKEKIYNKKFKGNIRSYGMKSGNQFYIKLQGDEKYRYLRKDEKNLGMELSQNKYDIKNLNLANKEKDCLMRTRKALSRVTCEELYEYMGEAYKEMVIS